MANLIMAMYALDKLKSTLYGQSKMPQDRGSFRVRRGANNGIC
jgi:hypothetical protein